MGRGLKVAAFSVGAMVLGAVLFAMMSGSKQAAQPESKVTVSWELDSLSQASDAPPPPVAGYTPTWIPTHGSGKASKSDGGSSSSGSSTTSESASSGGGQSSASNSGGAPADQPPPAEVTATTSDASPQPAPQQSVDSSPNNTGELREMLRRGK